MGKHSVDKFVGRHLLCICIFAEKAMILCEVDEQRFAGASPPSNIAERDKLSLN